MIGAGFRRGEQYAIGLTFLLTVAHVAITQGLANLCWYLAFGTALLLYGAAIGKVRATHSARGVLLVEAATGIVGTAAVITVAILVPERLVSQAIILSLLVVNVIVSVLLFTLNQNRPSVTIAAASNTESGLAPLTAILITTQLERLTISSLYPEFLTVISLAAGIVQAWRKVAMDDAVVFERIVHADAHLLPDRMDDELRRGFKVFVPAAVIAVCAYAMVPLIYDQLHRSGILKSLSLEAMRSVPLLMCVYFTSLPTGIVMVNVLRSGRLGVGRAGAAYLLTVMLVELVLLLATGSMPESTNLVWVVIGATASINLVLFWLLRRVHRLIDTKTLPVSATLYFIVVLTVICRNFI